MLEGLKDQVAAELSRHDACVLTTSGQQGVWAIPVRCHSTGLDVECLVPRWSDSVHFVCVDPELLLLIPAAGGAVQWLQYWGRVERVTNDPRSHYLTILVTPNRIDVIDEARGWGILESLEIQAANGGEMEIQPGNGRTVEERRRGRSPPRWRLEQG